MGGMTPYILTVFLVAFAVVRVTRLFTIDQLFDSWRSWWLDKYGVTGFVYLIHCPWCLSVWFGTAGAGVVQLVAPPPGINPVVNVVGLAAAYSLLTGVFCVHYGDAEGGEE